jgi:hypothetical protein
MRANGWERVAKRIERTREGRLEMLIYIMSYSTVSETINSHEEEKKNAGSNRWKWRWETHPGGQGVAGGGFSLRSVDVP